MFQSPRRYLIREYNNLKGYIYANINSYVLNGIFHLGFKKCNIRNILSLFVNFAKTFFGGIIVGFFKLKVHFLEA